jgi:DNA repair exonuclease SbcCD nuclease subunit
MGIRILHAADMHLGRAFSPLGALKAEARRDDLLETFDRICGLAVERRVAAFLIAGDLFDVLEPPEALVGRVRRGLGHVAGAGVRVFIVPGNHDDVWYPHPVWLQLQMPGVHIFDEATFTSQSFTAGGTDVHVHGVAYNPIICANPLARLQLAEPGLHLGLMHATVDPPAHFPVQQRYYPLDSQELRASGLHFTALGHVHRGKSFEHQGRVFALYPGSPEGLDASETGPRHAALLDFDGGAPRVELIPVNKREVRTIVLDVTDCSETEVAQQVARQASLELLATVKLRGHPRDLPNVELLQGQLERDFFSLQLHDETEIVASQWVEAIAGENTIRGLFVRRLRERIVAAQDETERATLNLALKLGLSALHKRSV